MNTNPKRGPFHHRSPSAMLYRTIRGMIPYKTKRGDAALKKLKVFEGVPHPYDKVKRQVIPNALRLLRLKPHRRFTRLGDLSKLFGWKHDALVQKLETKRKDRSHDFYVKKKAQAVLRQKAAATVAATNADNE